MNFLLLLLVTKDVFAETSMPTDSVNGQTQPPDPSSASATLLNKNRAAEDTFDYIFDVRSASEWASGNIDGSYNFPELLTNSSFATSFSNGACLAAKILVIDGNNGDEAWIAAQNLVSLNFSNVYAPSNWGLSEWNRSLVSDGTPPSELTCSTIDEKLAALEARMAAVMAIPDSSLTADADSLWLIFCGVLVFFMQAGFSLLEAGAVREKNVGNILYKNLMDAAIGALAFWLIGYAFAYGGTSNGFIGTSNFALSEEENSSPHGYSDFFFQWAFAATAATIVSGSVAERTKVSAYFCYSFCLSALIYPVVVHWVWASKGWLNGKFIDFAGSGVVHMVGGFAALWGAIIVKPRTGRFKDKDDKSVNAQDALTFPQHYVLPIDGHSTLLSALGTAILWVGWYGFNCGSTLAIIGSGKLAGKVAVVSTISAASSALTVTIIQKIWNKQYDLGESLNGVLAGLVAICASCSIIDLWMAFMIGAIAGVVYTSFSYLLKRCKVDDPLDAFPVHGGCGMWGVLAAGIFPKTDNVVFGGYDKITDPQFGWQLAGLLAIASWTSFTSFVLFYVINNTIGMRVDDDVEKKGLDITEHGTYAYERRATALATISQT